MNVNFVISIEKAAKTVPWKNKHNVLKHHCERELERNRLACAMTGCLHEDKLSLLTMKTVPHRWFGDRSYGLRDPGSARGLRAVLRLHRQAFFRVEPIEACGLHGPPVSSPHHRKSPIPEAHTARGELSPVHPQRFLGIAPTLIRRDARAIGNRLETRHSLT